MSRILTCVMILDYKKLFLMNYALPLTYKLPNIIYLLKHHLYVEKCYKCKNIRLSYYTEILFVFS
jgi:hypothetical protein